MAGCFCMAVPVNAQWHFKGILVICFNKDRVAFTRTLSDFMGATLNLPRVGELGQPLGVIRGMRLWEPLLLMGAGDKGLGDFQPELFLQVPMLGEGWGWWGRRGSTFVLEGSEQGLIQCYQPGTDPAGLLHLLAPLLCASATSCPTPPVPRGDRTHWQRVLPPLGNPQSPAVYSGGCEGAAAAGGSHGSRWARVEGGFSPRALLLLCAFGVWKCFLWSCRWPLCCL